MFEYIKGTIAYHGEGYLAIDVGGVGYKVNLCSEIKLEEGREITLYIHSVIREDAFDLYGFLRREERATFLTLISISGIGPKAAAAILTTLSIDKLALAVVTNDAKAITVCPGVGAKTAQRIILELKDKIKNEMLISPPPAEQKALPESGEDAVTALMVLGYSAIEAKTAVSAVKGEGLTVDEIIKKALINLL